VRPPAGRGGPGHDAAAVAGVSPTEHLGVGIEDFLPKTGDAAAHGVVFPDDGREVEGPQDLGTVRSLAQERNDRGGIVREVHPLEAGPVVIAAVHGRVPLMQAIEHAHEFHGPLMRREIEERPVQRLPGIPFLPLAEFTAHEQELLAGMGPHVGQKQAQVGHLLPLVPGHFADERALAVGDLVMGQRQDEILVEGIKHGEGELVLVVGTVDGVLGEVIQRVVHPAHVPLEGEAQASGIDRAGDTGPGGGFLGDHGRAGVVLVDEDVEVAQEVDGVDVFLAAVAVGNPLPLLSRIVEVEHARHGVDPQAVHVEFLEPVEGVGQEIVPDLVAAVIEDIGAPVGVFALARVFVFVEAGAVEAAQAPFVLGEMPRHPVHDDAEAGLVADVDQIAQVLGCAEAGGRGVGVADLVTPGLVQGMFGQGHELDVGKTQIAHIRNEFVGELAIGVKRAVLRRVPAPGPGVDLIDGDGVV